MRPELHDVRVLDIQGWMALETATPGRALLLHKRFTKGDDRLIRITKADKWA